MKVIITDEFNVDYVFETESVPEILSIVSDWLNGRDETPLYEITIQI